MFNLIKTLCKREKILVQIIYGSHSAINFRLKKEIKLLMESEFVVL